MLALRRSCTALFVLLVPGAVLSSQPSPSRGGATAALAPRATSHYPPDVQERIRQVEEHVAYARFRVAGKRDQTIADRMAHHHVPAVSIAVIRDFRLEWAKAYGWADVAEKRPATVHTLFEPGSISKSLHAMGVLRLAQEGKVDLHADINQYLTSWRFPYEPPTKGKLITLASLLSHTAGLGVHGFLGYVPGEPLPTLPQILDGTPPARSGPVRARSEPGLRYRYSGGGTMISQQVVADVTRQPYDAFMRAQVLEPLGMTSSFYTQPPPASLASLLASGYSANGVRIDGKYRVLAEQAAGGLWTTPTDLSRFIIDLQLSLQGRSNKVLSEHSARLMTTPVLEGAPGLGVFVDDMRGTRYFQHSAGNLGFSGMYFGSMEGGNGVVVFINSDSGTDLLREVITTVANVYQWKGFYSGETPPVRTAVRVPASTLDRFVGAYREDNQITTITREGDRLWYQASGTPWEMHFTSPTAFFSEESGSEKSFVVDANGSVTGFTRLVNGREVGRANRVAIVALPDSLAGRYAGTYLDGDRQHWRVVQQPGALVLESDGRRRLTYFLSATECYTLEEPGVIYRFVRDADGKVTGIVTLSGDEEELLPRVER